MIAWLIRKRKASFKNSVEGKELGEIYSVQEKMESQRGSCSRPGRANPFSRGTVLLRRAALQGSTQQRFSSTFIPKFRPFPGLCVAQLFPYPASLLLRFPALS